MFSAVLSAVRAMTSLVNEDSAMNSNIVMVALVQFMLACTPMVGQAGALDRENDPEQLWNIDRELFRDCLKQRDLLRVKHHRMVLPGAHVRMHAKFHQGDLLQELLTPEVIRPGSIQVAEVAGQSQKSRIENNRQENLLLKEFTAE
jgi:hypothetical protein